MPIDRVLAAVIAEKDQRPLIDTVREVVEMTDARLVVAAGWDEETYARAVEELDASSPDELANSYEPVQTLVESLDEAGIDYTLHGVVGDGGGRYVSLADAVDADRVVVQGSQRSPTGKAMFGSIAQDVLLNAPCPVTFVRTDYDG